MVIFLRILLCRTFQPHCNYCPKTIHTEISSTLYSQVVLLIEHLMLQSESYCSTFGMYMDSVDTYYY